MRISDWSSDVCSSDLSRLHTAAKAGTVMHSVVRFSAMLFAARAARTLGSCSDDKETGPVAVSIAGLPDDLAHPLSRQQRPAAQLMIGATGQGLVAFDAQGEIEPALAERWIVEDEGKSYIFRLGKANWRDGQKITAEQQGREQC